jgi:glycosyltransferase involved in cell wall biosynthesis
MRTHYFYRWCTMGGVERTLINRALILRRFDPAAGMTISFLEGGASLDLFRRALRHYALSEQVRVTEGVPADARLVIAVDAPDAFAHRRPDIPFVVECHTTYAENQRYLAALPAWVQAVVVPSEGLAQELAQKRLLRAPPIVLPNIMPQPPAPTAARRVWARRPIAYFGRLDAWKNTEELLQLWSILAKSRSDVFFVLAGPQTHQAEILAGLRDGGILDMTLRLPSVPFEAVSGLLRLVRDHCGLVVSASKGESFGWTAAEAIAEGVPVVLSDNDGHRALVRGDQRFLYRLGRPKEGAAIAAKALQNWDDWATALRPLRDAITDEERLYSAWQGLLERVGIRQPPDRKAASCAPFAAVPGVKAG